MAIFKLKQVNNEYLLKEIEDTITRTEVRTQAQFEVGGVKMNIIDVKDNKAVFVQVEGPKEIIVAKIGNSIRTDELPLWADVRKAIRVAIEKAEQKVLLKKEVM